jgi:hypothetical protein
VGADAAVRLFDFFSTSHHRRGEKFSAAIENWPVFSHFKGHCVHQGIASSRHCVIASSLLRLSGPAASLLALEGAAAAQEISPNHPMNPVQIFNLPYSFLALTSHRRVI